MLKYEEIKEKLETIKTTQKNMQRSIDIVTGEIKSLTQQLQELLNSKSPSEDILIEADKKIEELNIALSLRLKDMQQLVQEIDNLEKEM